LTSDSAVRAPPEGSPCMSRSTSASRPLAMPIAVSFWNTSRRP